jgi:hypothetical protein
MKTILFALCLSFFFHVVNGQNFPFGQISYKDLEMTSYEKDTSASAVVLNEFGRTFFNADWKMVFEYHSRVKVLTTEGLDEGNIEILLRNYYGDEDIISSRASVFYSDGGAMREYKFELKNILTEKVNKDYTVKKMVLPNIKVGCIIEVEYAIATPAKYAWNFRGWKFQNHLPKIRSEYWARVPGNFQYHITIKGNVPLKINEAAIVKGCFGETECVEYKLMMMDIPAFKEEQYITTKDNFLAAVNFELSQYTDDTGKTTKYTKEWKDVEKDLRDNNQFGSQIKKAKNVLRNKVDSLLVNETDGLAKAQKIYNYVKNGYSWNENLGKYTESGVSKAFENRKGNVADINLSLIGALTYAQLNVEPLILSTRDNGFPQELHPVTSDFNYVIAKLNIGEKVYLLDATDKLMPFNALPFRCLNGKGRVLGENESYWYEIKPFAKRKEIFALDLKLESNGVLKGKLSGSYIGYKAIEHRKEIKSFSSEKEYVADLDNKWTKLNILSHELGNVDAIDLPLTEKHEVEMDGFADVKQSTFYLNPFMIEKWQKNPFTSVNRQYPVDFGIPIEEIMVLNMELPDGIEVVDLPERVSLLLPNGGGKLIFDAVLNGNKLTINYALTIAKPVFNSAEYVLLKELFSRLIQVQNVDLVFKKKG